MKRSPLLTIRELAEWFGVSTDTIRRMAKAGLIPFMREKTAYRFDERAVLKALNTRAHERLDRGHVVESTAGGASRPRAPRKSPRLVTRGLG